MTTGADPEELEGPCANTKKLTRTARDEDKAEAGAQITVSVTIVLLHAPY